MRFFWLLTVGLAIGAAGGCVGTSSAPPAGGAAIQLVENPAGAASGMYSLAEAADGGVYLTWIEKSESAAALRFSRFDGGEWSVPATIAQGENWFVNWVDRPALAENGGVLVAHWLERPEAAREAKYGYGVRAARSADGGATWSPAFSVGMDNTSDYTGFVAYQPVGGGFLIAYLDPALEGAQQHGESESHIKTLRLADIGVDGEVREDLELDADVCTCCPLGIAQTGAGPAVVYRDHREGEIRDISIVRRVDGRWTQPRTVYPDGWQINGCPANGPSIAARGEHVAVAWFTAAGGTPRVRLARSGDGGAVFDEAVAVDDGDPLGWADVALSGDGSAVVLWLERDPAVEGRGKLLLRRVPTSGEREPAVLVSPTPGGRGAGVPQMASYGDSLLLAWREAERVQTALVALPREPAAR